MADTSATSEVSAPTALVGGTKKAKVAAAAASKKRAKPAHPKTSEMVANAIKNLKERGGSSLQAIKKYIAANYKVEAEKSAPFIKRYLKSAVLAGELVQTKGKGASGSFKLAGAGGASEKTAVKRPHAPTKAKDKKTTKKAVAVKAATGRKSAGSAAAAKKVAASKKAAAPKPKKAPSKAKKAAKSPTKKPKAPRPKKATPSKAKASPKKRK